MIYFTVGAIEIQEWEESDFQEFVGIAKGRSIISAGLWDNRRLELGLSGGLMLRIFTNGRPTEVNVITTVNPDVIPPIIVALGDLSQQVPLYLIEDKLNGLRTLYAIYYLIDQGRTVELANYLRENPYGDLERDLLTSDDRLFVESISYGSWLLALWTKSKKGYKAISSVAGLVFDRGREAYLRRLEAEARLLENRADREALQLAREHFDLQKDQMAYLLEVSEKIDAPEIKEQLKERILQSVHNLSLGDPKDHDADKRLID